VIRSSANSTKRETAVTRLCGASVRQADRRYSVATSRTNGGLRHKITSGRFR